MSKLKTHSGSKKRFKVTASGRVKAQAAGKRHGMVGQLCMFRLSSPSEHPYGSAVYGSRYQDQRGPTPSRSYRNFTRAETRRPS